MFDWDRSSAWEARLPPPLASIPRARRRRIRGQESACASLVLLRVIAAATRRARRSLRHLERELERLPDAVVLGLVVRLEQGQVGRDLLQSLGRADRLDLVDFLAHGNELGQGALWRLGALLANQLAESIGDAPELAAVAVSRDDIRLGLRRGRVVAVDVESPAAQDGLYEVAGSQLHPGAPDFQGDVVGRMVVDIGIGAPRLRAKGHGPAAAGRIYVQRLVAGDSRATGDLLEFVVGQAERSDDVLGL